MTPMMQQYFEIKNQYKDYLLFYRLGDFYEMFFDDAVLASRELELTLTGRDCGEAERAPMCGVPFHSSETYIAKLIQKGYKIAICEQTEDPAMAKGLVRREVIRVVTPGTLIETNLLTDTKNNYLCSVYMSEFECGVAFADVSTAQIFATSFCGDGIEARLKNELGTYAPSEVVTNLSEKKLGDTADFIKQRIGAMLTDNRPTQFEFESSLAAVREQFDDTVRDDAQRDRPLVCALGGLLSYIAANSSNSFAFCKALPITFDLKEIFTLSLKSLIICPSSLIYKL